MLRILVKPEGSKLAELSLKQHEMILAYQDDKKERYLASKKEKESIPKQKCKA